MTLGILGPQPPHIPSAGEVRGRVEGEIRGRVEGGIQSGIDTLAKELPALPGLPKIPNVSPEALIQRGLLEAGLPASPEAAVGMIMKEAGASVPFPIPTKLPGSVEEAVLMAVEYAAQAYGPDLIAAVGLGSVVPGIGNAVGFALAIGQMMVESGFKPAAVPRRSWECKTGFTFPANKFPQTLLIRMADAQMELLKVQNHRLGSRGNYLPSSRLTCVTRKKAEIRHMNKWIGRSVGMSTLPEVDGMLAVFDHYKTMGLSPSLRFTPEVKRIVADLRARRAGIFKLSNDVTAFLNRPPVPPAGAGRRVSKLMALEKRVLSQIRNASIAIIRTAKNPGLKRANLQQLAGYTRTFDRLETVKHALIKKMNVASGRKPPVTHTEATMRFELEGCGGNRACEARVRAKYGVAPAPTAPAPTSPTLDQRCNLIVAQWVSQNRAKARCLNEKDKKRLFKVCKKLAKQKITPARAIQRTNEIAAKACARIAGG